MNCQEAIDVMGDAVEGGLKPGQEAGFQRHMGECVPCRNYFEHLRLTRKALQLLPRGKSTSPQRDTLIDRFSKEFDGLPNDSETEQ